MIEENLPIMYNDEIVGEVFGYHIIGKDNDGFPIVCIDGRVFHRETFDEYPEYRYTRRVNNHIEVVGIE